MINPKSLSLLNYHERVLFSFSNKYIYTRDFRFITIKLKGEKKSFGMIHKMTNVFVEPITATFLVLPIIKLRISENNS